MTSLRWTLCYLGAWFLVTTLLTCAIQINSFLLPAKTIVYMFPLADTPDKNPWVFCLITLCSCVRVLEEKVFARQNSHSQWCRNHVMWRLGLVKNGYIDSIKTASLFFRNEGFKPFKWLPNIKDDLGSNAGLFRSYFSNPSWFIKLILLVSKATLGCK